MARRLAPIRLALCASPDYLARHGTPAEPDALAGHNCLPYSYAATGGTWQLTRGEERKTVAANGSFRANNGDALKAAALAGLGITVQPTFIVGEELRDGRLSHLLPEWTVPELSVYAVYAHRQYLSAKVRTFVDHLGQFFGSPPYWDQ